ncbi:10701_t:CDS:2, partial [Racocetra fulgida]
MGTELDPRIPTRIDDGLRLVLFDDERVKKYKQEVAKLKDEAARLRDLLGVDLDKLPELLNDKKLIDILTTQTTIELLLLKDEVNKLNSEKDELKSEKDQLKTEINDLQDERLHAENATEGLNQEIINLKTNLTLLEKKKNNLESNIEERKKVLEQEFNELKSELEEKRRSLELNINERLETKKSLEQEIAKLEVNLEDHRKNIESIASKQLEREKLEQKKQESDRKMKEIEEKLNKKKTRVSELEDKLISIENKRNELEVNKKDLKEAYLKYGQFKDEKYRGMAQQVILPLKQNIRDIETQLKEFDVIKNELSEAKKEIKNLNEQSKRENEFSNALKNDIQEYKEKFSNAQEDLKKKDILIDELRKELQQEKNNREIVELSREKGNLEKLISSTRVKVAERNLQGYLEMLDFEDEKTKETAKKHLNRILNDVELDALLNGPKRIEEIDQKLSK